MIERSVAKLTELAKSLVALPASLSNLYSLLPKYSLDLVGKKISALISQLDVNFESRMGKVLDEVSVLAEDQELLRLMDLLVGEFEYANANFRLPKNQAKEENSHQKVDEKFTVAASNLEVYVKDLMAYIDSLDEGSDEEGKRTIGQALADHLSSEASELIAPYKDLDVPDGVGVIDSVCEDEEGLLVSCGNVDWILDIKSKKLRLLEENASDDAERKEYVEGYTGDLDEDAAIAIASQDSFQLAADALLPYMTIANASDKGNNCLIYSLVGAAHKEITHDQAQNIRARVTNGNEYLESHHIPDLLGGLQIHDNVVVISAHQTVIDEGDDAPIRFVCEIFGETSNPLIIINANLIHFGYASLKEKVELVYQGDSLVSFKHS